MTKLQINQNRQNLSLFSLFLKREFLIYFLGLSSLISIVTGVVGIYLSFQGLDIISENGPRGQSILPILPGYIFCIFFTFLSIRVFYEQDLDYTINRPRTIIISQGITYFIAYFVGYGLTAYIPFDPASTETGIALYAENAVYYTANQFMAWLFGGFILTYFILVRKIEYKPFRVLQKSYPPRRSNFQPLDENAQVCVR